MGKGADKFVNPDILPHLPTAPQNTRSCFFMDQAFWADHRGPHGDLDDEVGVTAKNFSRCFSVERPDKLSMPAASLSSDLRR